MGVLLVLRADILPCADFTEEPNPTLLLALVGREVLGFFPPFSLGIPLFVLALVFKSDDDSDFEILEDFFPANKVFLISSSFASTDFDKFSSKSRAQAGIVLLFSGKLGLDSLILEEMTVDGRRDERAEFTTLLAGLATIGLAVITFTGFSVTALATAGVSLAEVAGWLTEVTRARDGEGGLE